MAKPTPKAEKQRPGRVRGTWRKLRSLPKKVLIIFLLIAIGITGGAAYYATTPKNPFPRSIREEANFLLYYPTKLPSGFKLQPDSFSSTGNVVIYYITYEKDKKLFVSIQPKPDGFDFTDFYEKKLSGSQDVASKYGRAVTGTADQTTIISVVTDNEWILMNSPSGISKDRIETITGHLKAVKPLG